MVGVGGSGVVFEVSVAEGAGWGGARVVAKVSHSRDTATAFAGIARLRGEVDADAPHVHPLKAEEARRASLPADVAVRTHGCGILELSDAAGFAGTSEAQTRLVPCLFLEECACDMLTATGLGVRSPPVARVLRRGEPPRGFRPFLEVEVFVRVAHEMAAILDRLHRRGIFARDWKLENLGVPLAAKDEDDGPLRLVRLLDLDASAFYEAPLHRDDAEGPAEGTREWYAARLERAAAAPGRVATFGVVAVTRVRHRTPILGSWLEAEEVLVDPVACGSHSLALSLWSACRGGSFFATRGFADPAAPEHRWMQRQLARVAEAVAFRLRITDAVTASPAQVHQYLSDLDAHFQTTGEDEDLLSPTDGRPAFDFFASDPADGFLPEPSHINIISSPDNPLHRPFVRRALLLLLLRCPMSPTVALTSLALFNLHRGVPVASSQDARTNILWRADWRSAAWSRHCEASATLATLSARLVLRRSLALSLLRDAVAALRVTNSGSEAEPAEAVRAVVPFFSLLRASTVVSTTRLGDSGDSESGASAGLRALWDIVPSPIHVFGTRDPDEWLEENCGRRGRGE